MFPLWAGLLIVGSLAPFFAGANDGAELSVRVDNGLVSLSAQNVALQDVIQAIATQSDLRVVQHVALDRVVTLNLDRQPLPDALDELLANNSYQLYQGVSLEDEIAAGNPVPSTLWIFSEGSSFAPAATIFLETIIFHGTFREKKEAIRELRRLGTPDAVQTLSLALSDEDSRVRDAAFAALSRISGDEAVATLSLALRDEDPAVRMHVVDALEEVGGEIAYQALMRAQSDEDPEVADAVNESLSLLVRQPPD